MKTLSCTPLLALAALVTLATLPADAQFRVVRDSKGRLRTIQVTDRNPDFMQLKNNADMVVRALRAGQKPRIRVGAYQDAQGNWIDKWRDVTEVVGTGTRANGFIGAALVKLGPEYEEARGQPAVNRTPPPIGRPRQPRTPPPIGKPRTPRIGQPGPGPQPRIPQTPLGNASAKPAAADPYAVFVVGVYNEVIVGRRSAIEAARQSSLTGWGLSNQTVKQSGAKFTMIRGPFRTAAEARQAYQANLIPNSTRVKPLALGTVARFRFDGKEHGIDNALDFLD
jgi:hypothetical protein